MRKEIIVIGILAMIAVCATLATAAPNPLVEEVIICDDENRVAFKSFDAGTEFTIEYDGPVIGSITETTTNWPIEYVAFGKCNKIDDDCQGVLGCVELPKGVYGITVTSEDFTTVTGTIKI